MKRNWDHTDCAVPLSGDFTAPPKWIEGAKYLPVYLNGVVVAYAPEATLHLGSNTGFSFSPGTPCQ